MSKLAFSKNSKPSRFLAFGLFFLFFTFFNFNSFAYYTAKITSGSPATIGTGTSFSGTTAPTAGANLGTVIVCSVNGAVNQNLCQDPNSSCTMIPTTSADGNTVALCTPSGVEYCLQNSDCTALGRSVCLDSPNSAVFNYYNSTNSTTGVTTVNTGYNAFYGICGSLQATSESNVISDAICVGVKLVTGKAGRAFVAICVIVMGVLFFTGKISWNMVLASALGCGAVFGAPAVVSLISGKPLTCK